MSACPEEALAYSFAGDVTHSWVREDVTCSAHAFSVQVRVGFEPETDDEKESLLPLLASGARRLPIVLATTRRELRAQSPSPVATTHVALRRFVADEYSRRCLPPPAQAWSPTRVAEVSSLPSGFHPVAAFTQLRWLHFHLSATQASPILPRALSTLPDDACRHLIGVILQHSHFVTSRCVPTLSAGLADRTGSGFHSALGAYIAEETGHHLLIEKALGALDQAPTPEGVHWSVRCAMDVLRWSAVHSPLALACAVGLFEQAAWSETDPVAARLDRMGLPLASRPLWTHFAINKQADHAAAGFELASTLPCADADDVVAASEAVDLLCALFQETERHYISVLPNV